MHAARAAKAAVHAGELNASDDQPETNCLQANNNKSNTNKHPHTTHGPNQQQQNTTTTTTPLHTHTHTPPHTHSTRTHRPNFLFHDAGRLMLSALYGLGFATAVCVGTRIRFSWCGCELLRDTQCCQTKDTHIASDSYDNMLCCTHVGKWCRHAPTYIHNKTNPHTDIDSHHRSLGRPGGLASRSINKQLPSSTKQMNITKTNAPTHTSTQQHITTQRR